MIQHNNNPKHEAFRHAATIEILMTKMLPQIAKLHDGATWADVGSLRASRDHVIEAAFVLGAITEEQAKDMGVDL